MITHSGTVTTTSATVLTNSSPTRGRTTNSNALFHPTDTAPHTTYPRGMAVAATRIATVAETSGPGRAAESDREPCAAGRESGGAGAITYNKPAFVIRSDTFCASSVEGSTLGACSESSGGRAGFAGTSLATGYSNELPFSSTSWPYLPVTNLMNCCAWSAFVLDLST